MNTTMSTARLRKLLKHLPTGIVITHNQNQQTVSTMKGTQLIAAVKTDFNLWQVQADPGLLRHLQGD